MNSICNVFNPIDKENGNFLLFSQYVEDLSKSVSDSTYKIRPSQFICMNWDFNPSAIEGVTVKGTDPYIETIPGYFQNIFENGIAALRSNDVMVSPVDFGLNFMDKLKSLIGDKFESCIKYIGNIDSTSWQDGFADILLSITSGASPIIATATDPITHSSYEYDNPSFDGEYYIYGWDKNSSSLPLSPITSQTITTSGDWDADTSKSVFDNFITTKEDTESNSFTFNTILILYDIEIDNNNYSGIPLGLYFTGKGIEGGISNPVTIYKSNVAAYGAGSGWSLRICTRFSSVPYGNLQVEEIELDPSIVPESISRVISAAAETIKTVREFANNSIYDSQTIKEMYSWIKNGRLNVPYVREVNGVKYWFVNGRNTEVPVYQN